MVLFDLDDTLFDHRASSRAGLASLQARYACLRRPSADELERAHSRVLEQFHAQVVRGVLSVDEARRARFRRLFALFEEVLTEDELSVATECYRDAYLLARRPVCGAGTLLERLKPVVKIGIVTNNIVAEQTAKLRHCGLERFVDALVTSEDAGAAKPDPAIFRIAAERLDCGTDEAVMVGDSWETDIIGARAAGMPAIWFNPLKHARPDSSVAEIHSLEPAEDIVPTLVGD